MKRTTILLISLVVLLISNNSAVHAQRITVTIAGDSISGFNGDSNPGYLTDLNAPYDVCADVSGNIYFT